MTKRDITFNRTLTNERANRYCNIVDILMSSSTPLTYKEIRRKLKFRNDECSYKSLYNLMLQISFDYPIMSERRGRADEFYISDEVKRQYMKERFKNLTAYSMSEESFEKLMKIISYLSTDNSEERLEYTLDLLHYSKQ